MSENSFAKRVGRFFAKFVSDPDAPNPAAPEPKAGGPSGGDLLREQVSAEGFLRVSPRQENQVELCSTLCSAPLFAVKARLGGTLAKFIKNGPDREVVVTVPLVLADGSKTSLKVSYFGPPKPGNTALCLISAHNSRNSETSSLYEFSYNNERGELRYAAEVDDRIEVLGFQEVVDKRPLFPTVPPVAQMAAFLRAVTSRKRTVLTVLENLKDFAEFSTRQKINALQERVSIQGVAVSMEVPLRIKELLSRQVSIISEQVIMAFALFMDMEVDGLSLEQIRSLDQVEASFISLYSVATYFGAKIGPEEWEFLFGTTAQTQEEVQGKLQGDIYHQVTAKFGSQIGNRTPAYVLQQIAKESHSMRALSFANSLQERLGDRDLAISDQQLALLATLSVAKRHYNPNVVAALCLFVDAEVGYVTEEDLQAENIEINGIDTSTYAMLAVAGAFDVDLRGFNLGELSDAALSQVLPALIDTTGVGFLGGFRKGEEAKQSWHWVRTKQAAARALQPTKGLEFTKTILCALPVIQQLSEIDLVHLVESGRRFIAAFQSDYDKTIVWRRLQDIPEESFRTPSPEDSARQNYSYIEGFSAFHFSRTVIGALRKTSAEELLGSRQVIMVFHDNRDNRHYKYLESLDSETDLLPPPNTGWVWKEEIVADIDTDGLPSQMNELNLDALLGRSAQYTREYRLLNWMFESLRKSVLRPVPYGLLADKPGLQQQIRACLDREQLRHQAHSFVDEYTFNVMLNAIEDDDSPLDIKMPTQLLNGTYNEEQAETLTLFLLFSLAESATLDLLLNGYYKQVDSAGFRVCLNERLQALLGSDQTAAKLLALHLITCQELAQDPSARLTIDYTLSNALQDGNPEVEFTACESRLRLSFTHAMPLPACALFAKRKTEDDYEEEEEAEEEDEISALALDGLDPNLVLEITQDINAWLSDMEDNAPARYRELELMDENGNLVEDRMQTLVKFVAGLRQASQQDQAEPEHSYYALIQTDRLQRTVHAIVASWQAMIKQSGSTLAELQSQSTAAELHLDQRFYAQRHKDEIMMRFGAYPFLGSPEEPLTVYHLKADETISPFRIVSQSLSESGRDRSPLFAALVPLLFSVGPEGLAVLRLHSAEGQDFFELESYLSQFETTHNVDLHNAEWFDPDRLSFVPVFKRLDFSPERAAMSPEDLADFRNLMGIMGGRKFVVKKDTGDGEESELEAEAETEDIADENAAEPDFDHLLIEEGEDILRNGPGLDMQPYQELAGELRQAFSMTADLERPIVNMLLLLERRSGIELKKATEPDTLDA